MTYVKLFEIVSIGCLVIPCISTISFFAFISKPNNRYIRAVLAIFIGWCIAVIYTIYIFNPSGISAGHEQVMHFPEAHFDNNTIASTIAGGWIYPMLALMFYQIVRLAGLYILTKLKRT